ncbi:cystatin-M [Mixophyes fleayi]|uniref:cystatin-M n=1 Tax=Mixophyes fleayi TaxID=3061075 RepID=UPI003F4DCC9F
MILPVLLCFLLSCCQYVHVEEVIKAENSPGVGGWYRMPLNSRKVANLTKFLENSYNENSDSLYWFKIKKVLDAVIQVTNGINYQLTMIIEPTGCLKEEDFETCKSSALDGMKVENCHFYLKELPSNFKTVILSKTCEEM